MIPSPTLNLPVITSRETVVYPGTIISFQVENENEITALNRALEAEDRRVFIVAPRDPANISPGPDGLCLRGTLAEIVQLMRVDDGPAKLIAEGTEEAAVENYRYDGALLTADLLPLEHPLEATRNLAALQRALLDQFKTHASLVEGKIPPEIVSSVEQIENPLNLVYQIANYAQINLQKKQAILESPGLESKINTVLQAVQEENDVRELEQSILSQVRSQIGDSQREYFLNEQIKVIERELGVNEDERDLSDLNERIRKTKLTKEAREKAKSELSRLSRMQPISPEATVSRTYIETMLDLPWGKTTRDNRNLDRAEKILDEDHHALEKVKERILEYLAVLTRVREIRGPILCLVGPPGVGKTSLARSVARTLNRKFVRVALGGVRDEAEIRGHRRTYIGSMPGKVLQSLKKAGSVNPVFLLDEIDKMSHDFRGDPASALLEVLDPEQNKEFNDHYLEVDFDLSKVLFITTANTRAGIPAPLLDRMETISLAGYTEEEKVNIADRFILPRQLKAHGLKPDDLSIDRETIRGVIRNYTREAGVRNLERKMSGLCRKVVRRVVQQDAKLPFKLTATIAREMLGPPRYKDAAHQLEPELAVATGLAWTEVGGEILQVESAVLPGKGNLVLTGKQGDVMQESAKAAVSYIRGRAKELVIDPDFHQKSDLHIHLPEGAVPKDGPSAGVTMVTSLASALSGRLVRQDIAMTGEINLRGKVLRIGGLKEKVLAAHREKIMEIILPKDNEDDLEDIPQEIRDVLTFHPVESLDEVLKLMLLPDEKKSAKKSSKPKPKKSTSASSKSTTTRKPATKRPPKSPRRPQLN
jgi:ATP-dependent Lon protease